MKCSNNKLYHIKKYRFPIVKKFGKRYLFALFLQRFLFFTNFYFAITIILIFFTNCTSYFIPLWRIWLNFGVYLFYYLPVICIKNLTQEVLKKCIFYTKIAWLIFIIGVLCTTRCILHLNFFERLGFQWKFLVKE